jgi:hypothetical protein
MRTLFTLPLVTAALVLCTWATTPLARVSSTQPFERNGATVPVAGVASWPLFAGDVIVTHSAPATIVVRGGNRIVLDPNSELKLDAKNRKPVARLLHGSGKYFLAGTIVTLSTTAEIALDGKDTPGNPNTPGYQKPPSPSPSR